MTRLADFVRTKIESGEKLLSVFVTAGFPDRKATLPLLGTLAEAGADLLELGVPFSDPLADGPTIQMASHHALQAGITLPAALDMVSTFCSRSEVPVLLMGYANPFMQFGWERLAAEAEEAGAAGLIIPDLPPEESGEMEPLFARHGLSLIHLISPNTRPERMAFIDRKSEAFIYAVSVTGVTGARKALPVSTLEYVQRLKQQVRHPVLVGFGVSGPETARQLCRYADGVIIGSAVIQMIRESRTTEEACDRVYAFVRKIKQAISE